jgi:hypothetical protein
MNLKNLILFLIVLTSVGCASQSSVLVSGAQPGQRIVKTQRLGLWGLISSDKFWDPRTQCPNGVSKIDVGDFVNFLGVYSSYDVSAWCSAGVTAGQGSSVIIMR